VAFYTFAKLKAAVEHGLGGTPDSRITSGEIVNRAIEFVENFHPWAFLEGTADLAFVAAQNWIDLPADFREIIDVFGNVAKFTHISPATHREILAHRVHGVAGNLYLKYRVDWKASGDGTAPPTPVLNIAPAAADSTANALILYYRRRIRTFATSGTADDAQVLNVPEGLQAAVWAVCRAKGICEEQDSQSPEWTAAIALLSSARDADGRQGPANMGRIQGGLVDDWYFGAGSTLRPHSEIRMPGDV
jgi:hypothetical protein